MDVKFFPAALLLAASAFSCFAAEVKLYTWEDYLANEVIEAFQAETGHRVKQVFFDDEDARDIVITSGRANGFDLLLIDNLTLQTFGKQEYFRDLAQVTLANRQQIAGRWQQTCGRQGLPYAWGTVGIAYRTSLTDRPVTSWRQLFRPDKAFQGRIVLSLEVIDTPAAALLALGYSPHSADKGELRQVYGLLKAQQPHILTYQYGYSYALDQGSDSQMAMTFAFSGDTESISEATGQADWTYVVPEEGSILWVDCLVAPAKRALSVATRAFLDFLNRPAMAALNAQSSWFATPNQGALAMADKDYLADQGLFPAQAVLSRSEPYQTISADGLRLRARMLNALGK